MSDRVGRWQQFSGTGAIATGNVFLLSLRLTVTSGAGAVDIKEGGTGGTVVVSLAIGANGGADWIEAPFAIKDPFISAISGTGAKLSVLI